MISCNQCFYYTSRTRQTLNELCVARDVTINRCHYEPTPIEAWASNYCSKYKAKNRKTSAPKSLRVKENTPLMVEIGSWFGRRAKNLWTLDEAKKLGIVEGTDPEDMEVMKIYYNADIPTKTNYRRRDITTLLNNWVSEIDRSKEYCYEHKLWKGYKRGGR